MGALIGFCCEGRARAKKRAPPGRRHWPPFSAGPQTKQPNQDHLAAPLFTSLTDQEHVQHTRYKHGTATRTRQGARGELKPGA